LRTQALRGFFLVVRNNSVLCLLGHNGAGKTTAINILTGADTADKGDAVMFGKSVSADMDAVRALLVRLSSASARRFLVRMILKRMGAC
jgi:ATP-binding cassette subfamily A (ABC1) protein 3